MSHGFVSVGLRAVLFVTNVYDYGVDAICRSQQPHCGGAVRPLVDRSKMLDIGQIEKPGKDEAEPHVESEYTERDGQAGKHLGKQFMKFGIVEIGFAHPFRFG